MTKEQYLDHCKKLEPKEEKSDMEQAIEKAAEQAGVSVEEVETILKAQTDCAVELLKAGGDFDKAEPAMDKILDKVKPVQKKKVKRKAPSKK